MLGKKALEINSSEKNRLLRLEQPVIVIIHFLFT